ncbi:MAG: aldehyde dehydrogenase family protein [Actinomycetota bacterium]
MAALQGEPRMLIDGRLVEASNGATFDNVNPATEEVLGVAADATEDDLNAAVAAARRAFDQTDWSTNRELRARCLEQLKAALEEAREELRAVIVAEAGSPVALTYVAQLDEPISGFQFWIDQAKNYEFERPLDNVVSTGLPSRGLELREPIGVVGAITPFNFPLMLALNKIGPALAAGCTVVHKAAPETPWSATILGRLIAEKTDIPAGVVNVLTSSRDEIGAALVAHPDVDMITFTGSTATGRKILASAAETVKRVHLELGGKSASIVLDDADLGMATGFLASMACAHSGQACARHTRALIPRSRYEEATGILTALFQGLKCGDPTDPQFLHGPQITSAQRDIVLQQIDRAVAEGAKVAAGGGKPDYMDRGYWVQPTLLLDVDPDSLTAKEEIFGPVLAVIPYEDEEDAVRLANDSIYGLSGGVWSQDEQRALAFAKRIRAGTVSINLSLFVHASWPFGGYRQSGLGREGGVQGFEEFLETKVVSLPGG